MQDFLTIVGRRNLTPAWLIELELGNKEDLLARGREKKKEAGEQYGAKHPKELLSQNDKTFEPEPPSVSTKAQPKPEPKSSPKHNTQKEIAKAAGVSTGQVGMAEQVRKKALSEAGNKGNEIRWGETSPVSQNDIPDIEQPSIESDKCQVLHQ